MITQVRALVQDHDREGHKLMYCQCYSQAQMCGDGSVTVTALADICVVWVYFFFLESAAAHFLQGAHTLLAAFNNQPLNNTMAGEELLSLSMCLTS